MKRTLRKLHASFYAFCVMRCGGRLGRLCGSERAGRGCAVLLVFCCVVTVVVCAMMEFAYVSRAVLMSARRDHAIKPAGSQTDVWGRDTSTDLHFMTKSLAYADLDAAEQTRQRAFHEEIEKHKRILVDPHAVHYQSQVIPGARDPNAFRLNAPLGASLPRPVEAMVDGIAILRPPGTPALPHVQTLWRSYTPAELYERHDALDYIYSFVNGSEANHYYRKSLRVRCGPRILALEEAHFWTSKKLQTSPLDHEAATTTTAAPTDILGNLEQDCPYFKSMMHLSNEEFLSRFSGPATAKSVDNRDRETDELRHSIRSLEQHVRWHRGRVVIVSPGHHPTWVDGAKNFLAGACGDVSVQALRLRGTHLRLTTVHQDAVMPYGIRLTVNSHSIEQHIWRVRNITPVHVYMNDDYFVNRDVAITDLFNEYGGTIVRVESGPVVQGKRASESVSWAEGVENTELFNIVHLEQLQEDYLPRSLARYWENVLRLDERTTAWEKLLTKVKEKARRLAGKSRSNEEEAAVEKEIRLVLSFRELLLAANTSSYWEAALESPVEVTPLPDGKYSAAQSRYYATHAPFVYCTNMFRHFSVRFKEVFAPIQLRHRERKARDLFVPFLYNAYIVARPWEASAQFLPYLLQLRQATMQAAEETKKNLHKLPGLTAPYFNVRLRAEFEQHLSKLVDNISIYLDNEDGCAPATLYRSPASDVMYMQAEDDVEKNRRTIQQILQSQVLYFNINAGFATTAAADQVRAFLHDKFPTPVFLEKTTAANAVADAVLTPTFDALMALPVVGVVSYEEGACPLVRSLWLAFARHHRGRVHVAVQRHGLGEAGEADESLRETRRRLGHRVISALPATDCSYSPRVSLGTSVRDESLAELAARVIGRLDAGVELPSTCGHSGDNDAAAAGAGLRVRGFVIDARTPSAPVKSVGALR
ncbi:hypothetical protein N2W54_000293, partial [Lotmaria passim]